MAQAVLYVSATGNQAGVGSPMNTKSKLRLLVARALIATTTSVCLPPHAHAGVISTDAAISGDRAHILMLLDRPDISAQLEARGVKPSDAKARIAALSDAEIAQLSAGIDEARAGGGSGGAWGMLLLLLLPFGLIFLVAKLASRASESKKSDAAAAAH